jgi:hypothetical protein
MTACAATAAAFTTSGATAADDENVSETSRSYR